MIGAWGITITPTDQNFVLLSNPLFSVDAIIVDEDTQPDISLLYNALNNIDIIISSTLNTITLREDDTEFWRLANHNVKLQWIDGYKKNISDFVNNDLSNVYGKVFVKTL